MSKGRYIGDYLEDIIEAIDDIFSFTQGMNYEKFNSDKRTTNAVIRSLEVLGEATKHIPEEFRIQQPDIPWSKMAGLRDVLIHDYMGVDMKTVWKVITERLPEIAPMLRSIVDNYTNDD